jgi:autotransporter-associated beta strand protein
VIELSESATITGDVVITASGALSPSTGNPAAVGGTLSFRDQSGAGEGTFRSEGGTVPGASGGHIIFRDSSTADRGTFTAAGGGVLNGNGSSIEFYGTASAGHARFMNLGGAHDASKGGSGGIPAISMASGGEMIFHDDSSAGEANIVNAGGAARIARGAYLFFRDSATAGHSSVKNIGGEAVGSLGGFTVFEGAATAGRSTIVATGSTADFAYGASIAFGGNTSADDALLVAMGGEAGRSGGEIYLGHNSDGWTARVAVFGNGSLDISAHQEPGVAIGSLEGSGIVYLGSRDLTIGTNNLTRDFSGSVLDRRPFSSEMLGGGIIKIGAGTLTLSGQSSYSGPTTVNAGRLLVTGSLTSAVFVNGGTFGGSGFIAALTVSGSARLSPGEEPGTTGILTVTGRTALRRSPSSSSPLYVVDLNGLAPGTQHDQLSARGGVNLESATLSVTVRFQPLHGATFTIINNDSPEPLVGTFDGLPEGARFTSGGQTFAISYLGGSGNDVVLTALPPSPRMPRNAAR